MDETYTTSKAAHPARGQYRIMLDTLHSVSDPLAWISISAFLLAITFDVTGRRREALPVATAAWVMFAGFWLSMFPYYYLDFQSPLYTIGSLAAVPLCLLTAYHLSTGRDSLLVLTRAVGLMGLVYLPVMVYEPFERYLIEIVTIQSHAGMELVGYSPGIEEGLNGYQSRFAFEGYSTYIVLACTGIGSMAIFGGLIAATSAPWRRKLLAIGLSVSIIWVLNIIRNVFVGLAAPLGWFDYPVLHTLTAILAGSGMRTSFFVSHHLIAQTGAVIALVAIAMVIIKLVPEVLEVLEEGIFVVTGTEFDLQDAFAEEPLRADGGASDVEGKR